MTKIYITSSPQLFDLINTNQFHLMANYLKYDNQVNRSPNMSPILHNNKISSQIEQKPYQNFRANLYVNANNNQGLKQIQSEHSLSQIINHHQQPSMPVIYEYSELRNHNKSIKTSLSPDKNPKNRKESKDFNVKSMILQQIESPNKNTGHKDNPKSKILRILQPLKPINTEHKPINLHKNKDAMNGNDGQLSSSSAILLNNENKLANRLQINFIQGYHEQIIQKCSDLIYTESDMFILENNFPELFKEYIVMQNNNNNPKGGNVLSSICKTPTSIFSEKLLRIDPGSSTNTIKSLMSVKSDIKARSNKNGIRLQPLSPELFKHEKESAIKGNMNNLIEKDNPSRISVKPIMQLSNSMDVDLFKRSLLCNDPNLSTNCELILIYSPNKYTNTDLGFAEISFGNEYNNKKSCEIKKLYLAKVYRKLNMAIKVYSKLMEYIFNQYYLNKISITLLYGNESQTTDLMDIGFQLEKVLSNSDNIQYRVIALKRNHFIKMNGE